MNRKKKLKLDPRTIRTLTETEAKRVAGGDPYWSNLWTWYECDPIQSCVSKCSGCNTADYTHDHGAP